MGLPSNVRLIAVNEAVAVLNRIHEADPTVLPYLIGHRTRCNEELANDESVQVSWKQEGYYEVGLLGIINGLYGVDEKGIGFILADVDDRTGEIHRFRVSDNV